LRDITHKRDVDIIALVDMAHNCIWASDRDKRKGGKFLEGKKDNLDRDKERKTT